MTDLVLDILFVQAIRFYLFEFYVFKSVRNYIKSFGWYVKKLIECPFCHGFWCGVIYYIARHGAGDFFSIIQFGFITSFVSFAWFVFSYKPLKYLDTDLVSK